MRGLKCYSKLDDIKNSQKCPMAKINKLPFLNKGSRASVLFELVHPDVWGPYQLPSHDNKMYFLIIIAEF